MGIQKRLLELELYPEPLCPICQRPKHKDWWSCKECTKRYTAGEYNDLLIKLLK